MAQVDQLFQAKELVNFLVQVREHGTPLRVDSETETYYVLTAAQLMKLMQAVPSDSSDDSDFNDDSSFALQDFGLTEADLAAYEVQQQVQQMVANPQKQRPLSADLKRRLDAVRQTARFSPQAMQKEREQLLQELEIAMADNLRAFLPEPQ